MEAAIAALITSVGAVLVAIMSRPRPEATKTQGLRVPPPWVSALCLVAGLYMIALTMVIGAQYALVLAWISATILVGILLVAGTPVESLQLFSGTVVFLLLVTLTILHRDGTPRDPYSTIQTTWAFVVAICASIFLVRFARRGRVTSRSSTSTE